MLKPLQHHPPTSRTEFESGNKYVLETTKEETIERSSLTGYDKRQASFVILWFLSVHSFAENVGRFARCRIRNGFFWVKLQFFKDSRLHNVYVHWKREMQNTSKIWYDFIIERLNLEEFLNNDSCLFVEVASFWGTHFVVFITCIFDLES